MKALFTTVFICIGVFSYCQFPGIEWKKSYGGSDSDAANSIYQTADGGSVVAGVTKSSDGDVVGYIRNFDGWIIKLDAAGNIMWQKVLGGSSRDVINSIVQTFDGGYIVAGYTASKDGNAIGNHGNYDAWVIKLDGAGAVQWQKCYGGSGEDKAYKIRQTSDSGYILACNTNSQDGDVKSIHTDDYYHDYWIVKLNKDGTIKWNRCFGGSYDEYIHSVEQTPDSGYILGGATYSYSTNGDYFDFTGILVIKLNANGQPQWQKHTPGDESSSEYAEVVKPISDTNYILAKHSYHFIGDESGPYIYDQVYKTDSNLNNFEWGASREGGYNTDLQIIKDGYVLSTEVRPDYESPQYGLGKIGINGDILWDTIFGGTGDDEPTSISCDANGSCIVAGESNSTDGAVTGNHGDYDFWIVKLKPDNVLPVKFISFTAQKQNNTTLLQWQTANEINNNYFDIERSPDSKLFTSIGNKPAANITTKSNYAFVDNAPLNGINYYRLKQVDKDGKFAYSKIVSVYFNNIVAKFAVYPNPANNTLNITLPSINKTSDIVLYDATGKKVLHEQLASNINTKQINISKLPAGIYNIVLTQDGKQKTIKVVKK